MDCVYQCPGLAIFGYNPKKDWLFLPIEYAVEEKSEVYLVDNNGERLGEGIVEKILRKKNKTHIARVKSLKFIGNNITEVRGFISKNIYPEKFEFAEKLPEMESETYICHCDDVKLNDILHVVGDRKFISVDEIKHTTRLGMGACRGSRCIKRLKQSIRPYGISIIDEATPRGPLSNQINLGELYPKKANEKIIGQINKSIKKVKVQSLVAGGGIAGSALFRYLAEAGQNPILLNFGRGGSWRNIAGGRSNFSLPELAEIASENLNIFKELQEISNIDFLPINYVTFAHNDEMYNALQNSMSWSEAEMIEPKDFRRKISHYINPDIKKYNAALVTKNCWQATPGKVIDLIRRIGLDQGGNVLEDCKLINLEKEKNVFKVLVQTHEKEYIEYETENFINALGSDGNLFAKKLGIETELFSVKHQAFITRRLPHLGLNNSPLPMMIDRQKYKGFSAVYGQQLVETGQIIGCASPMNEANETGKNVKISSKEFIEIVSEVFLDWLPQLSSVGFQALWSGYYVEPRMIIDADLGLFIGLRGQGFMLGQHLAKLYVDKITGKNVPEYFNRLAINGDGLLEKAFK
jgi:glycine/D-amino acid oxidase-like deaminating enzyme/bacterioferritin-associated ferredoxin